MKEINYEEMLLEQMYKLDPEATKLYEMIKSQGTRAELYMFIRLMERGEKMNNSIQQLAEEVGSLAYDIERVRQESGISRI